jgi:outer membrane protein TolC
VLGNGKGGGDREERGAPRLGAAAATAWLAALASGCLTAAAVPGLRPEAAAPPAVDRLWKPPEPAHASLADLPATERSLPERRGETPDRPYDLPELIDVALQRNPETRRAWERARASAAQVGRAVAPYYPELGFSAQWGPERFENRTAPETTTVHQDFSAPSVRLTWTLVDFGRRSSSLEAARQELMAAGLAFNREVQTVVFRTQRAFFLYDAARARVRAAEQNLELARTVREDVDDRLRLGLATEPGALLARQAEAEAAFELENARSAVDDTRALLAVALGVPANLPLEVVSLADEPLPPAIGADVDELIDLAVRRRPDLGARVAAVRAREAAIERARAELWPEIGFHGLWGVDLSEYSLNGAPRERTDSPVYGALLRFDWRLFEGFERLNAIKQAEADNEAARADLAAAEIEAIAAVWRAYSDFRTAQKKLQFADALLRASQDAYDSNADTYRTGLSTITELLDAETDLARARYTVIDSRAQLLVSSAAIAYATGIADPGGAGSTPPLP